MSPTTAAHPPLRLATFRYDTTQALLDGHVQVAGFPVVVHEPASIVELFEAMLDRHAFDVAELGLTYYLRTLDHGAPFVAVPAFPARAFRHASVWVRADGSVQDPADLAGRPLGEFGMYGQDAGVWIKGILADECGFDPQASEWIVGGLDAPAEPFAFAPPPHAPGTTVRPAPRDAGLVQLLREGVIDALFTSNVPQTVLDGSTGIRPLFADAETREQDWYRRTGIFPVMHTVVLRREMVHTAPDLARAVWEAFRASKNVAADRYRHGRRLCQVTTMIPWAHQAVERTHDLLGDDWWPYGVAANRTTLDAALRYHHEQGITSRRFDVDEVFAPDLLDT